MITRWYSATINESRCRSATLERRPRDERDRRKEQSSFSHQIPETIHNCRHASALAPNHSQLPQSMAVVMPFVLRASSAGTRAAAVLHFNEASASLLQTCQRLAFFKCSSSVQPFDLHPSSLLIALVQSNRQEPFRSVKVGTARKACHK